MKIQMTGGPPWGFKMTGGRDFRQPLAVGKVTAGSKAERAGLAQGHHILTVNGEDVTQLAHLDAQNKIKAAKTSLVMEISNAPVPSPAAPTVNTLPHTPPSYKPQTNTGYSNPPSSIPVNKAPTAYGANLSPTHIKSYSQSSGMSSPRSPNHIKSFSQCSSTSRSPTHSSSSYDGSKSATPDIKYRPVDSRDSQRRTYEELLDSDYHPTAHQSTTQSPSMKKLTIHSGLTPEPPGEKKSVHITEEIKDMISEAEAEKRYNGLQRDGTNDSGLRTTGIKTYNPEQRYSNRSASHSSAPSYDSQSSHSSQSSNLSYDHSPDQPTKSIAAGNIAKFIQSSGAKPGPPSFLKPLQDLQCPIGDPAVLEIRIGNSLPVPTVAWYHNEKPVRESREKDIKFLNRGIVHTLVIGTFDKEFAGRYRCILTNKHGSTKCSSILSVEHTGTGAQYSNVPPPTYSNNNPRGYQPSYTSNYSHQPQRTSKPPVASNSIGLYSQSSAQDAYNVMTKKKSVSDDMEESPVMRALREQGEVGNDKPHQQSRSMKMLEDTLMPESDDL